MRPEGALDVRIRNPIGINSGAGGGRNTFGRPYRAIFICHPTQA
jgi:hypothetical protein